MMKRGAPEKLTDGLKSIVAEIKDKRPRRRPKQIQEDLRLYLLNNEEVKREFANDGEYAQKSQREFNIFIEERKLPGVSRISKYLTELNNNTVNNPPSPPWHTGTLSRERIEPEATPWLIGLQSMRKSNYSKPITIREAKWFSYLSGFRKTYTDDLSDFLSKTIGINNDRSKNVFLSYVIATWAELYAYREKIDTNAGIKDPDFSDLDDNIAKGDMESIYQRNDRHLFAEIDRLANKKDVSAKELTDFDSRYLLPSLIDQIRFQEIRILGHSLGEPDMPIKSILLYSDILTWILADNPAGLERLMKLNWVLKIGFLIEIRKLVKANPEEDDRNIDSTVNELITNLEEQDTSPIDKPINKDLMKLATTMPFHCFLTFRINA